MAARVELREISNDEGNRLLRLIRRNSGSVVTWRRAQIVLLAAQRMPPARIAEVVFTDADTVRDVIHNFNRDGFDSLYPHYKGGRPRSFTLPERQEIKRVALSVPSDLGQPFATWSLAKLADYLVAEEVDRWRRSRPFSPVAFSLASQRQVAGRRARPLRRAHAHGGAPRRVCRRRLSPSVRAWAACPRGARAVGASARLARVAGRRSLRPC